LAFKRPIYEKEHLRIYEYPEENHVYITTVDVSHGKELDYSAFTVFDITTIPYRQVATYQNNEISPLLYPSAIADISRKYNEAYVIVEINDIGKQVADILHYDLEYDNLLTVISNSFKGQRLGGGFSKNTQFGVKTSTQVKNIGCQNLKSLIEEDKLIIVDYNTIYELSTFIQKSKSFEADIGAHDDLVMNCVVLGWVMTQQYMKDVCNQDMRIEIYQKKIKDIEDDLCPFGFIETGIYDSDNPKTDPDGVVWNL
jgi:hypothetical protein